MWYPMRVLHKIMRIGFYPVLIISTVLNLRAWTSYVHGFDIWTALVIVESLALILAWSSPYFISRKIFSENTLLIPFFVLVAFLVPRFLFLLAL